MLCTKVGNNNQDISESGSEILQNSLTLFKLHLT